MVQEIFSPQSGSFPATALFNRKMDPSSLEVWHDLKFLMLSDRSLAVEVKESSKQTRAPSFET
jgi:hypothetical protein